MALEHVQASAKAMVLPALVFGQIEVHRLQRELEALDEYVAQSSIRTPGQQPKLPVTSRLLDALAAENNVNLLVDKQRTQLAAFLQLVIAEAPVLHISFAADPSPAFMVKIVTWFRERVHTHALIHVGLQPNIAAGCVVRTPNRLFDFSLASHFSQKRDLLIQLLEGEHAQ
jgi:F0F1-type ATP synthase delta subunit